MAGEIPEFIPEEIIQPPTPMVEAEAVVKEVVLFDRRAYDEQWRKDKITHRLANLSIAHGYVHTGNGREYYHHGIGTMKKKSRR